MYHKEQSYNTSFNIPSSSLSPSMSYNYSLVVTLVLSDRTVASYTGSLWTASTNTTTTSVLPSSADITLATSSHGTVMILMFS